MTPVQAQLILDWYEQLHLADSVIKSQAVTIQKQDSTLSSYERKIFIYEALSMTTDSVISTYESEVKKHIDKENYYKDLYDSEKPKKWIWAGIPSALLVLTLFVAIK